MKIFLPALRQTRSNDDAFNPLRGSQARSYHSSRYRIKAYIGMEMREADVYPAFWQFIAYRLISVLM